MTARGPRDEAGAMTCETFLEQVLLHIDGELSGARGVAAAAHVAACGGCAERADLERAFEVRLAAALATDAAPAVVETGVRRAATGAPRAGRLLRPTPWLRRGAIVAASLFVIVQGAWFLCIPPFECSYLQALEAAVDAPATAAELCSPKLSGLVPPALLAGFTLDEGPHVAPLRLRAVPEALRARYTRGDETITVVWSDPNGHEPSFRRRVERDGLMWWIADEHGRTVVAWMCPRTHTLCSLVGALPEERLLEVAEAVRAPAE